MVYDPQRRFVLAVVDTQSDGSELLVDPENLETVRREDVGAPRTIVDDILRRVRMFVQRPDWLAKMFVRRRVSYCFSGPTGSGKSFHLKLIATEVTDLVEELTGKRSSRPTLTGVKWTRQGSRKPTPRAKGSFCTNGNRPPSK